jgi:hypothetical protein
VATTPWFVHEVLLRKGHFALSAFTGKLEELASRAGKTTALRLGATFDVDFTDAQTACIVLEVPSLRREWRYEIAAC